jgi:hypothetical protein
MDLATWAQVRGCRGGGPGRWTAQVPWRQGGVAVVMGLSLDHVGGEEWLLESPGVGGDGIVWIMCGKLGLEFFGG